MSTSRETGRGDSPRRLRYLLTVVLLLAYSLAVHFEVRGDIHGLAAVILLLSVVACVLVAALRTRRYALAGLWFALLALAVLQLAYGDDDRWLLALPPILINAGLMILFGRTLRRGSVPMISRFAAIWRGTLDARTRHYTLRATQAWVIFFALMTLESVLLALFASPPVWSLFTQLLNYLFVMLFFVIEYAVRLHVLSHLEHPGFSPFVRRLLKVEFRKLIA